MSTSHSTMRALSAFAARHSWRPLPRRTAAAALALAFGVPMEQAYNRLDALVADGLARNVGVPLTDAAGRSKGAEPGIAWSSRAASSIDR